jgi:type II secretory ATPase GspE/PulE/Tfp pilus assembly ATPase PilB-like protein
MQKNPLARLEQLVTLSGSEPETADTFTVSESSSPAGRWWHRLIQTAVQQDCSDILIESQGVHHKVCLRVAGTWRKHPVLVDKDSIGFIQLQAGMDPSESSGPQDGRLTWAVNGSLLLLRLSVIPSLNGKSLVLRLLNPQTPLMRPAELGLTADLFHQWSALFKSRPGLYLFTGPTGAGKTTSLHSLLRSQDLENYKVMTVEDPIEYLLEGAVQTAVNAEAGQTFATIARSFLRHDPDIIVIGEIRDQETAAVAVNAALSGHRVCATLHCPEPSAAPLRLEQLGVKTWLLSECLQGILGQRLQTVDGQRKATFDWLPAERLFLGNTVHPVA